MSAVPIATEVSPASLLPPARAFGREARDLDLSLSGDNRPALVTALLVACSQPEARGSAPVEDAIWDLSVSARIARLLRVVQLTLQTEALPLVVNCPRAECGQSFELELPFQPLITSGEQAAGAAQVIPFPTAPTEVALRLPTGRDQAVWRATAFQEQQNPLETIIRSLATEPARLPKLNDEQLAALAAQMETADPLVSFSVETICPHCQQSVSIPVDLEAASLHQLAEFRRRVLREVDEFATAYGWSEVEVLAISPERRAEYRRIMAAKEKGFA